MACRPWGFIPTTAFDTVGEPLRALTLIALSLAACTPSPPPPVFAEPEDLGLVARAGQVVIAPPPLRGPIHQGGILVAGPGLGDLDRLKADIADWRARSPLPLLVAVDAELGLLHRLRGHDALPEIPPRPHRLPASDIEELGRGVGLVLREVGVDLVFAPVADVAETGHLAKQRRTASGDPERVIEVALAYNRGLRAAGLLTIAKHYPGYGDTEQSSDQRAVRVGWDTVDLHAPVFAAVAPHVDGMMLSNLAYGSDAPAVASQELVRRARRLAPVLFTDDVVALRRTWDRPDITSEAFRRGVHVIVTASPPDWVTVAGPVHGAQSWALADPAIELVATVEREPAHRARLRSHVCAVWQLMVRSGRRQVGCGPPG